MGTLFWILATLTVVCLGKLLLPDTQTTTMVLLLAVIAGGVLAAFGVGEKRANKEDSKKSKS